MQTQGLSPMDLDRPRGLADELGESHCACGARRGGEAGSEASEHQDSSVICPRWAAHQWDRRDLHFSFSDFVCLFVSFLLLKGFSIESELNQPPARSDRGCGQPWGDIQEQGETWERGTEKEQGIGGAVKLLCPSSCDFILSLGAEASRSSHGCRWLQSHQK